MLGQVGPDSRQFVAAEGQIESDAPVAGYRHPLRIEDDFKAVGDVGGLEVEDGPDHVAYRLGLTRMAPGDLAGSIPVAEDGLVEIGVEILLVTNEVEADEAFGHVGMFDEFGVLPLTGPHALVLERQDEADAARPMAVERFVNEANGLALVPSELHVLVDGEVQPRVINLLGGQTGTDGLDAGVDQVFSPSKFVENSELVQEPVEVSGFVWAEGHLAEHVVFAFRQVLEAQLPNRVPDERDGNTTT